MSPKGIKYMFQIIYRFPIDRMHLIHENYASFMYQFWAGNFFKEIQIELMVVIT